MKDISELLKNIKLHPRGYIKLGKAVQCETDNGIVVIKDNKIDDKIIRYLKTRNFNYYPEILYRDDNYLITSYIDDIDISFDQKILDLINLVALLHSKTTHYKEVDEASYKELYEDIKNNIYYLNEYYNDIINIIETKNYMNPWEYLFARNISQIFYMLDIASNLVESWYEKVKELHKMRVVVLHNNLDLSHFKKGEFDYLVSWDKSKIGIPSFDLYKLYLNHALDFSFIDILKVYEDNYPLKEEEKELLLLLINMPLKIDITDNCYDMCCKISYELDRLYKALEILNSTKKV